MRTLLVTLFFASSAFAQRPIFDPDDFVDPKLHGGKAFVSTLIAGAAKNAIDGYRPLHGDVGFVQLTNNFYWSRWQFSWKHAEVRAKNDAPPVFQCGQCGDTIFFPTPALPEQTPDAPPAGSRDTLQLGWYRNIERGERTPLVVRSRLTWSHQSIDTTIHAPATGQVVRRLSGDEQTFGLDTDTHVRIRRYDVFGSLAVARTIRRGTVNDRTQNAIVYTNRFPAIPVERFLLRTAVTVGAITNRGGTAINLINPWVELFWYERNTRANLHLAWSPQLIRSGAGWETDHQIALFADRTLFVTLFGRQ